MSGCLGQCTIVILLHVIATSFFYLTGQFLKDRLGWVSQMWIFWELWNKFCRPKECWNTLLTNWNTLLTKKVIVVP